MLKRVVSGQWRMVAFSLFLAVCALVTGVADSDAAVSGQCANCHTMHFSQNGTTTRSADALVIGSGTGDCMDCHAQERAMLLKQSCLGCHASNPSGNASNIDAATNAPQVAHNAASDLAGGNFYNVFRTNPANATPAVAYAKGHNVHGFGGLNVGTDSNGPMYPPPGYNAAFDVSSVNWSPAWGVNPRLMCAGSQGCHGNRDQTSPIGAISGAHHADDSMLKSATYNEAAQRTSVGTSYRYMYMVAGLEDDDWEATVNASNHNYYKGRIPADRSTLNGFAAWADVLTISDSCAQCHGNFHMGGAAGIGTAPDSASTTPWVRHPVDVALPIGGEYGSYDPVNNYDPTVPVAWVNPGTPVRSEATVMCLSCHKAHASQYPDALRWDYSGVLAAGTGCKACHTTK